MQVENGVLTMDQVDLLRRERLALARLTDKQKAFCEEYVRTFDPILAMKAGGYSLPKYTRGGSQQKMLGLAFDEIMSSEAVQSYLALLKQSVASRIGVSMDGIVDEFKALAFSNMDDYVEWTDAGITKYKSSENLSRAQKAGILEITQTTSKAGTTIKIKLHPKQPALLQLFEILKELEDHEKAPEKAAKISQTQINLILQDPTKRRAIEHLAESMFERQINLVGTDKQKLAFDAQLEKITTRLLEVTDGVTSHGRAGGPGGKETRLIAAESADAGNHREEDPAGEEQEPADCGLQPGEEEGIAGSEAEIDITPGSRYDIDGL